MVDSNGSHRGSISAFGIGALSHTYKPNASCPQSQAENGDQRAVAVMLKGEFPHEVRIGVVGGRQALELIAIARIGLLLLRMMRLDVRNESHSDRTATVRGFGRFQFETSTECTR